MKRMLIALALLAPAAALAESAPVAPGLPGWSELTFDDYAPNRWRAEDGALVVESDQGSSVLYRTVSADLARTPVLRWRWRVDSGPPATDLTQKGGEDRAIALTVGFAYDPDNASLGERLRRVVVEQAAGADAPGRIVAFAWGDDDPPGTVLPNPYSGSAGRIVVARPASAPQGQWLDESVDLDALYRRIWGAPPPKAVRIAISADGDDTGTAVRARIRDIEFTPR